MGQNDIDVARYEKMEYARCGRSGLKLPRISLGGWHNFTEFEKTKELVCGAFDLGINHIDMANNYGPPPGRAEEVLGEVLKKDLKGYRDELLISSKAGWGMWPGPYGDFGSKKYLIASCEQSLKRLGVDYVDIFYSHRPDMETPLDETMGALEQLVKQGKALYAGISSYDAARTRLAAESLRGGRVPLTIHQPLYHMMDRWIEDGLLDAADDIGFGVIVFCPLAQGLLTNKYLNGVPKDSRAADPDGFLQESAVTEEMVGKLQQLNSIAEECGMSLAQMSLKWVLRDKRVTSALIGASRLSQIEENVKVLEMDDLSEDVLNRIDKVLGY
ncbi:L-glyceraldehyde 3-phosphate reductase [Poriferisphaera corsica]|uniref:L-glyceraldehyde 3-phosphate reductase n=1 Tax=Poriferisphaera corsica TaxID=2528020 RepID=A0A517YQ94_9BACT|nr:aldo/keto reductase [Poriferisphaera corsica]QDU32389.1 L-glyceraldehyde 3-phosphate reductase [Poriferisphaera corsica]